MFLSDVTDRGSVAALVKTLEFNEARLRMIAENVANMHTPGYRAKHLDVKGFQQALSEALEAKSRDPRRPFVVQHGSELATAPNGALRVTPSEAPAENVLFHDGTNLSIEEQMGELAQTGMTNELATALLRDRMTGLRKAIRGTV